MFECFEGGLSTCTASKSYQELWFQRRVMWTCDMLRSHNFNLKSLKLGTGSLLPKNPLSLFLLHATLSEKHSPDQKSCSIAFHLHPFLFSKKSSYLLFPPSCRCSPSPFSMHLVSTEPGTNWMCFPCSRSMVVAPIQLIKSQFSHTLPGMCFASNERYF